MKIRFLLLFLLCSAFTYPLYANTIPSQNYVESPTVKENKDYHIATFKVKTQRGWGSGFAIGSNLVVTCAHVVMKRDGKLNSNITLESNSKIGIKAKVIFYNIENDIALLQTEEVFPIYYKLSSKSAIKGDNVAVIRSRPEYVAKFTPAIIKEVWVYTNGGKGGLLDEIIDSGNSGSPVVNTEYEVIGYIIAAVAVSRDGVYHSVETIRNAINDIKKEDKIK